MAIELRWVRFGRPSAEALREAVAASKGDDALRPVTVVVPSNHVGVATRRLLGSGELGPASGRGLGIAAVSFLTIYRLAELLGASRLAAEGRRPVSTPIIAAALRRRLAAAPGIFAPVADHPATEMALVAAYQQLRDLSPGALAALAGRGERSRDLVQLHLAVRELLRPEFSDEEDLLDSACGLLAVAPEASSTLGSVIVYLPQLLSRHGARLLSAVGEAGGLLVLAGTTGDPQADRHVHQSLSRLGLWSDGTSAPPVTGVSPASVAGAAPPLVTGVTPPALADVSIDRTGILTASDADEEVRAAVRAVVDAARSGVRLERIAILYGTQEPYGRLVHEQLTAAGIAHNGQAVVSLTARVAGRALLGLFELAQTGFRREDVFAWLSAAPLLSDGRWVPVTAWERISREAGVVKGRDQWDGRLDTYAKSREHEATRLRDDSGGELPGWRIEQQLELAERARSLRRFMLGLIDDLGTASTGPRSWSAHATWARQQLAALLGGEGRRGGWPPVEQKAAERTERALDRLANLDTVEGPVGVEVFARTLQLELESDLGRVGRIGEGVLLGTVPMGIGLDLDLVIVLGLFEGSLPAPWRDDALLAEADRASTGGELPLRRDDAWRQRHAFLASLAAGRRQLLCLPRGDLRRSSEHAASRWLVEVASSLAGRPVSGEDLEWMPDPWIDQVPSFDAGLRRLASPATAQEHRLTALMAAASAGSPGAGCEVDGRERTGPPFESLDDQVAAAGASMVRARRSPRFTRFDGNLSGTRVPSPAEAATSATRLELWARCPFAYFAKEILRVETVERPEDRLSISSLDKGSLIHEVLERFIVEVLARPAHQQPAPGEPWTDRDRQRMRELANETCDDYEERGLVGRPIFWRRDRHRIVEDLLQFVDRDNERRAERGTRPVAAELAFGTPGAPLPPVALLLGDGRQVRFRGKADRVDTALDGHLEILDYKTGKAKDHKGLTEEEPDGRGTKFQLAVYALAARLSVGEPEVPVRSEYWFTSKDQAFERIGYDVTDAVLQRVGQTVQTVVEGIEAGVFPAYPSDTSTTPGNFVNCDYCDPDRLGVVDLLRQLERKRSDGALALFLDLVEGEG